MYYLVARLPSIRAPKTSHHPLIFLPSGEGNTPTTSSTTLAFTSFPSFMTFPSLPSAINLLTSPKKCLLTNQIVFIFIYLRWWLRWPVLADTASASQRAGAPLTPARHPGFYLPWIAAGARTVMLMPASSATSVYLHKCDQSFWDLQVREWKLNIRGVVNEVSCTKQPENNLSIIFVDIKAHWNMIFADEGSRTDMIWSVSHVLFAVPITNRKYKFGLWIYWIEITHISQFMIHKDGIKVNLLRKILKKERCGCRSISSYLRAVDIHTGGEATGVQGVLLLLFLALHVVDSDPLPVLEQEHRHLEVHWQLYTFSVAITGTFRQWCWQWQWNLSGAGGCKVPGWKTF